MHITDFKDEIVLRRAAEILQAKIKRTDAPVMSNPTTVKQYLQYRLVREDREGFFVLYLDTKCGYSITSSSETTFCRLPNKGCSSAALFRCVAATAHFVAS